MASEITPLSAFFDPTKMVQFGLQFQQLQAQQAQLEQGQRRLELSEIQEARQQAMQTANVMKLAFNERQDALKEAIKSMPNGPLKLKTLNEFLRAPAVFEQRLATQFGIPVDAVRTQPYQISEQDWNADGPLIEKAMVGTDDERRDALTQLAARDPENAKRVSDMVQKEHARAGFRRMGDEAGLGDSDTTGAAIAESRELQEQIAKTVAMDPLSRERLETMRVDLNRKKNAVASVTAESELLMPAQFDARRLFDDEETLRAYAELGEKKKQATSPEMAKEIEQVAFSQNPKLKAFHESSVDKLQQTGASVAQIIRARGELELRRNALNRGAATDIQPEDDSELVQGKLNALSRVQDLREKQQAYLTDPNATTFKRFQDAYQSLNGHIEQLGKKRATFEQERIGLAQQAQTFRQQTFDAKQADARALAAVQDAFTQAGDLTPRGVAKARAAAIKANPELADAIRRVDAKNVLEAAKDPNKPLVSIDQKQESAFESKLGEKQAEAIVKSREAADDAVEILNTVAQGRQLLNSGTITGFGADWIVGAGQALGRIGFDTGEAVSNTQAFASTMAQNVGKLIKQFGSGTGLSDADREYAEKMAGGRITLEEKSIRKILDINERAARNVIRRHNQRVKGIKTNVPLEVEEPHVPTQGAPQAGASLPTVKSDADFDALPSGTVFIGPDGKQRRKP